MYKVADSLRDKVILLMAKDLGLMLQDFISIRKDEIPDLSMEPPVPFHKQTQKEKILARGFLSEETVNILKAYMPTLRKDNPYLFQNHKGGHITDDTVNNIIRDLAARAGIKNS